MSKEIFKRMEEVNANLRYHSRKYHLEDNPEITDFEYDLLFNELRKLEESHPHLILPNSIVREVGYKIKKGFHPFTHPVPMGSLDNAMTFDEVTHFIQRRNNDLGEDVREYFLSLKLDGLALELIYVKGKLRVSATRGNGEVGENITQNAFQIRNIPKVLPPPFPDNLIIRGEVIMTKELFEKLNLELEAKGEPTFANPRNAAAGTIRQLDENIVKKRQLFFYPYALTNWEDCLKLNSASNLADGSENFFKPLEPLEPILSTLSTQSGQMNFIGEKGFILNPHTTLAHNFSEIKAFCENMQKKRDHLDYEIDGVVIKINSGKYQNALGIVGRRPRYAIAWKLPPEIKKTVLEDIIFQVGRTGKITPVAILKPVRISGVEVRRATLHNFQEIRDKDIRIHDTVEIIRSGDVIPKILGIVKEERGIFSQEIVFPSNCPVCHSPVITEENGTLSFCRNQQCPSRQYHNIIHFASKEAFNIEGLGKEIIQELIQNGKLKDAGDIFYLKDSDLNVLKRVGKKLKSNLLSAIENSKSVTLSKLLYALGIPTVGEKTSKVLARKFTTIENLMNLNRDSLMEIDEVGEVMANNIDSFFSHIQNQTLIQKLIHAGIRIQSPRDNRDTKKLYNKKILFTGTLTVPRRRAKELAEGAGAQIVSTVSKNLDYLVEGENPGSKKRNAEKLHIKIISEEDFLKLIHD